MQDFDPVSWRPGCKARRWTAARRGHAPPSPFPLHADRERVLPFRTRAYSSAGERSPHTREVAGSKPATPTGADRLFSMVNDAVHGKRQDACRHDQGRLAILFAVCADEVVVQPLILGSTGASCRPRGIAAAELLHAVNAVSCATLCGAP